MGLKIQFSLYMLIKFDTCVILFDIRLSNSSDSILIWSWADCLGYHHRCRWNLSLKPNFNSKVGNPRTLPVILHQPDKANEQVEIWSVKLACSELTPTLIKQLMALLCRVYTVWLDWANIERFQLKTKWTSRANMTQTFKFQISNFSEPKKKEEEEEEEEEGEEGEGEKRNKTEREKERKREREK